MWMARSTAGGWPTARARCRTGPGCRHGEAAFSFAVLDRVKERADPDFDYEAELQALLALWQGAAGRCVRPWRPAMSAAALYLELPCIVPSRAATAPG
jgi:hypothetical protein